MFPWTPENGQFKNKQQKTKETSKTPYKAKASLPDQGASSLEAVHNAPDACKLKTAVHQWGLCLSVHLCICFCLSVCLCYLSDSLCVSASISVCLFVSVCVDVWDGNLEIYWNNYSIESSFPASPHLFLASCLLTVGLELVGSFISMLSTESWVTSFWKQVGYK